MSVISSTQTIVTEVGLRVNEDSTTAAFEDQVITAINQCTNDVASEFPTAPFLQTSAVSAVVAGTQRYGPIADLEKIYGIIDVANNQKLAYLPAEQFFTALPSATQGRPTAYTVFPNQSVAFGLIPDSNYSYNVLYHKLLGTISALSSTPPIPTKYNELYCLFGEMDGLRKQQRYAEADDVEVRYKALKEKMIKDLSDQTAEAVPLRGPRDFADVGATDNPIVNIYNSW